MTLKEVSIHSFNLFLKKYFYLLYIYVEKFNVVLEIFLTIITIKLLLFSSQVNISGIRNVTFKSLFVSKWSWLMHLIPNK